MEPVITPLSQPLNSFPHFMPNQVLTHTQLNELAVYLEQQDRFTRQRLIGIGIVCGLQAKLITTGTRTVKISRGVGVTSCGFLIDVPDELTFTKKKSYTTPNDYVPFLLGAADTPISCIELKPGNSTESNISDLTNADVTNKIVVLFLDLEDKPNGKCIGENCDEKGNKWVFTLRVLLIDRSGANVNSLHNINRVLLESYTPNVFGNPLSNDADREDFFNPEYRLPTVFAERFGNVNGINPNVDFNLSAINTFQLFESTYRTIILDSSVRVAQALHKTYTLFKPVFDTQLVINANPFSGYQNPLVSNTLANKLKDLLDNTKPQYKRGNCQYVYDFVRDLIDTYHELRSEFFALTSECSPDPSKFPRHLLLGELTTNVDFGKFTYEDYDPPTVYRNHFIYSPILNVQSSHLKKAKMLIQRIKLMIDTLSFSSILGSEEIKITPDKSCTDPLGQQRIPFYYHVEGATALSRYWNYDYTIQNRTFENRSYWSSAYVPSTLPNDLKAKLIYPLLYDICSLPKLAIEGHVGKNLQAAVEDLTGLRKQFNLSFDILALKLDQQLNEVYFADDNLIADLQAQYLSERNELVCCLEDLLEFTEKSDKLIGYMFLLMLFILSDDLPGLSNPNIDWPAIIDALIMAYKTSITQMIEALPPDIKEFDFPLMYTVFPAFSSFTTLFKYSVNTWGDIEAFLLNDKDGSGISSMKFKWVISDLISVVLNIWELYIDKIDDDCVLGKFYTIFYNFYHRVQQFSLFDKFNEVVHGMEHIAGTSRGGTFIIVYEDTSTKKNYTASIVDEAKKPVEGAIVVDPEDHRILYGISDNQGKFTAKMPTSGKAIKIMKPGHASIVMKITDKSEKILMPTYCGIAAGKKGKYAKKLSPVDSVYVNIKATYDELKAADRAGFGKLDTFINLDFSSKSVQPLKIGPKESFRVVADFYLPHLIHNYKTKTDPLDACKDLGEIKLIDFNIIAKSLAKNAAFKNASFKNAGMKADSNSFYNVYGEKPF